MKSVLYVVSDIHLGGEPGEEASPGFQICPQRNQVALADFIRKLPISSENSDVHLVLAGDIVDFLAEKEFAAFTAIPDKALTKLKHIVRHSEPVWKALTDFVDNGNALTLMLGNHDIEMSLPDSRRFLMDLIGKGRVSFIYDNEAFTLGPVLIEHGNRYDGWNAVAHGALRRARSRLSRGARC